MTTIRTTSAARRAAELAQIDRRVEELRAEEAAHLAAVSRAVEEAAYARCDAVEQLYEMLQIEPVEGDPEETQRAENLVREVAFLLGDDYAAA